MVKVFRIIYKTIYINEFINLRALAQRLSPSIKTPIVDFRMLVRWPALNEYNRTTKCVTLCAEPRNACGYVTGLTCCLEEEWENRSMCTEPSYWQE